MAHANEHPTGSKGHHEYVAPSTAKDTHQSGGYREKEYEHQEYPKHVGSNDQGQPIIAKSEKEEKDFRAAQAKKAQPAKSQE